MKGKYSNFLTIALIVVIVLIVIGIGFLIYGIVADIQNNKNKEEAIAQFDTEIENNKKEDENNGEIGELIAPESTNNNNSNAGTEKKQYYQNYVMLGYIQIKKTNIKYPILETATAKALEIAVGVTYPTSNPQLNEPGNIVIAGHNYRNNKMFSKNKNLSTGDKIYITSNDGRTLTYTIYEKFETSVSDTTYMTRDTRTEQRKFL